MLFKNNILFFVFAVIFLSLGACSKANIEGEGDSEKVTIEQRIKGKWSISGSEDIKSIEFIGGNIYMLELPFNSTLLNASIRRGMAQVPFSKMEKLASSGVRSNVMPVSTKILSETYTVSADGKSIILDNVGTVTVNNLTAEAFNFSMDFAGKKTITVSSKAVTPLSTSDKTLTLARAWKSTDWHPPVAAYESEEFIRNGFKTQDNTMIFGSSGTLIRTDVQAVEITFNPSDGSVISSIIKKDTIYGNWKWKDDSQTVICTDDERRQWYGDGSFTLHRVRDTLYIEEISTSNLTLREANSLFSFSLTAK